MKFPLLLAIALASGCGSPAEQADAILGSSQIRAAVTAIGASANPNLAYCRNIPGSVAGFTPMSEMIDPLFTTKTCECVAATDATQVGLKCQVDLTLVADSDGEFHQVNFGAISSGSGKVFLFTRNGSSGVLVQENDAQGAGCTQKNYNVIVFDVTSECCMTYVPFCALTYTLESTCGHANTWKASAGTWSESLR